jgi:hypothetical protein
LSISIGSHLQRFASKPEKFLPEHWIIQSRQLFDEIRKSEIEIFPYPSNSSDCYNFVLQKEDESADCTKQRLMWIYVDEGKFTIAPAELDEDKSFDKDLETIQLLIAQISLT